MGKTFGGPGAVGKLKTYVGNTNTTIMVEWDATGYIGGEPFRYEIEAKPYTSDGSGEYSTADVSHTGGTMMSTVTVSGPGVITWIRVRAVNALDQGPWTEYIGISMNP